jgi:hypothetical protein
MPRRALSRLTRSPAALHVLQRYQPPRAKKLRLSDVKEMFEQMKDHP